MEARNIFEAGLGRGPANCTPLTPLVFLPAQGLKDIIISGGENIASIAVEAALTRHPAVALAAVVARPDEKWGEAPCAFVELRPGTALTAEELIAFAREHLPHFAVPRTVIFGPLPTTATGKIQKFELRERARTL